MTTAALLAAFAAPALVQAEEATFGGVGIDGVATPGGGILVKQIVAGAPAHQAGIRTGDEIIEIDGKPTRGIPFHTLVETRLRGKPGSPIVLTVRRPGITPPLRFVVERAILAAPREETRKRRSE